MFSGARQLIRNNRRSTFFRTIASASEKFLRAYYNDSFFEFDRNGESFVIRTFSNWLDGSECSIWDVGANKGQWALTVRDIIPNSTITSFEILTPIFDLLTVNSKGKERWIVENFGFSDKEGTVIVTWNRSFDTTSSIKPASDNFWFDHNNLVEIECNISTIDAYSARTGTSPDFLKIDTEGHDAAVLFGARDLLTSENAPTLIQFEYGHTWLPSGAMLGPVHHQLESAGYRLGRVYPNYVDFKKFETSDENFRMGNIVAVKNARLASLLSA